MITVLLKLKTLLIFDVCYCQIGICFRGYGSPRAVL